MNGEEIKSLISQLKAAGLDEEQIMDVFYETFEKGEMDRKDLETLANAMGYELTDEFKNEPSKDPIETGISEAAEGGISKEEAEAAKALEPGETSEEFEEKIEEMKDGEGKIESESESESEEKEEALGAAEPEAKEEEKEEDKFESESESEEKEESTAEVGEETSEEEEEDEEKDWEKAQKLFRI